METFSKRRMMFLVVFLLGSIAVANGFSVKPKDGSIKSSTANDPSPNKMSMAFETERPLIELNFEASVGNEPLNTGSETNSTFIVTYPTPAMRFDNLPPGKVGLSRDFGITPGNYFIESTEPLEGLKNLNAFTITGWVNCTSNATGSGGNRIISWINNGGDGVDLVYRSDGRLALGIDQWPDSSPAISSPGKIPTDASASVDNWVFFAVTYQSSTSQVQFYFGNTEDAMFDVTRTYNRGAVGSNIGKLAIGHFNDATRLSALDRMFKGLIDNISVYGSVLSASDIVTIQQTSGAPDTEPPIPPTLTLLSKTNTSVTVSWEGASDNVGVTNYILYSGATALPFYIYPESSSYNISDLTPNTAYSFTIKAVDAANNMSLASNVLNVTTDNAPLVQTNTKTGYKALHSNTSGYNNSAYGYEALFSNTEGVGNTASGADALFSNTGASSYNSAFGYAALRSTTEGQRNNAFGTEALFHNTAGNSNSAFGDRSLYANLHGFNNAALGHASLSFNTRGSHNTSIGSNTLVYNIIGSYNTALGFAAGSRIGLNNLHNSTAIGTGATTTASNQVRIGDSNVTSIGGQVSWSTLSDGRFKKDIKNDVSGLAFIDQLRPVSYSINKEAVDKFLAIPDGLREKSSEAREKPERQTGFVAQEVEAVIKKTGYVFHGVEAPKNEQDHYSIRYAEFVVPLVKAVQELSTTVKEQQLEIYELKKQIAKNASTDRKGASEIELELYQNNPNPFTLDTEIKMTLPESTLQATVIVYNLEGKELKSYPVRERGNGSVKITGNELKAGMYIYALIADGKVVDTKRMILTK